ncbi:unnamed protein product [Onchocerca ochengi]|uniref:Exocyst complex component Sec6 n=1 Tax=Onchocerca ochengi TaxID=42157 RepID=A0A182EC96_ONCOC|nr:unnamed protein product [Onchocerca ochengi]
MIFQIRKQYKAMAVLRQPNTTEETLICDHSFEFEMDEMEAMEMRIRKMMIDKETIAKLIPSLSEYMRIRSKLGLCLHLLLDSASIVTDVKSCILDGKLFKAYKNFIKYEKCRNDLLELTENESDEQKFIIGHFNDVELMAIQIHDVIQLTLAGSTDSGNDSISINDDVIQQILKIVKYDAKLDADNEVRKDKSLVGFLNRPRNWKNFCMRMLADSKQTGTRISFTKQLLESLLDSDANNGDMQELIIEHDMAYSEELLAMKKYFQETLICEANFRKILENFLKKEDIFEQANNHVANSNLLAAIEKLLKAESIRYHLLAFAESHKEVDAINELLTSYYEPIEQIYAKFIDEAKYYCTRGIDIMRGKNPETKKQLEVILRAVEIDEKIDKLYANNQFKIANRPHCWSKMLFKIIEERVQQRVEAFQIEDRKLNQNWVIRNLEICRSYIVEDLYAAKHFLRIFPKEHQLYNNFIIFYHNGIVSKISELAKGELNKRELIQLLSWIRQYPGEHMLGMAFLEIDAISLVNDKPLIERSELMRLFDMFVEIIKSETANWALKTVKKEFANTEELRSNILEDEFEHYYTHLPHILYSIVNDQMTLACEISDEIVPRVLNECLNEYIRLICPQLKDSIIELKSNEMHQKEYSEEYTTIMISIANNLNMFADSVEKLEKYIEGMGDQSFIWKRIQNRKRISTISQSLSDSTVDKQKEKRLNRKMQGAIHGAINAFKDIPATLANITPSSSENVLYELNGNSTNQLNDESEVEIELEDEEPLEAAWERIEILKEQFNDMLRMAKNLTNVLNSIAEFIMLRDKGMLLLEIASLLRKYPEMTQEFLFTLTDIRDDVTSSESRALTEDCMKMIGKKENDPVLIQLFQMAKGERKTSQVIKDVVPRLRRRVRVSIANQ